MNKLSKITVLAATLVTMGSLAACQSTTQSQEPPARHMMDGHYGKHGMKRHQLTPEQRAEMEQRRAERKAQFEQIQKACDGKAAGQSIQVKVGDKTIDGTCEIRFKPNRMDKRVAPPVPVQAS